MPRRSQPSRTGKQGSKQVARALPRAPGSQTTPAPKAARARAREGAKLRERAPCRDLAEWYRRLRRAQRRWGETGVGSDSVPLLRAMRAGRLRR